MLIDFHVHIKRTSGCAKAPASNMAKAAAKAGIDGIVILDHNYHATIDDCLEVIDASEGKVTPYRGCEISIREGHHVVCITEADLDIRMPCSWATFVEWRVRNRAVSILAHPFKDSSKILIDLWTDTLDGIEYTSPKAPMPNRKLVYDVAEEYNLRMVANSDSHRMRDLGSHANFCSGLPYDTQSLVTRFNSMDLHPYERILAPIDLSGHEND